MAIKVIGTPGGIHKPNVKIGSEPIATLSIEFPVGQLARASCGVKPESVAAAKKSTSITADGNILFTGIGWAPRGRATASSLDFGFSMIHPAQKIDEGRTWAPGLHPLSTEHYTFTMGGDGYDERDTSLFGDQRLFRFHLTKSLAEEIPDFIVRGMQTANAQRQSTNLQQAGLDGNVALNSPEVIAALKGIQGIGGCKIAVEDLSSTGIHNAASRYAQGLMENSVTANKSTWDLVAMMMSAFGMQLICWPDGTIKACPDFSGCKPPDGNRITGDIIDSWEGAAEYTRAPRGVVVISYGFSRGVSGTPPSNPNSQAYDPLAGNEGEFITDRPGSLFVTTLPQWMMPHTQGSLPNLPKDLIKKYAKQIFAEVSNMGRTFVISTPLCPDARPGTTYYFEPISKAKNLTDGGEVETPFSAEYAGYCYKINHTANANGQFHTHWFFRNVFEPSEYDFMVETAPFFEDKPFEVGAGNSEGGGDSGEAGDGGMGGTLQTGGLTTGGLTTGGLTTGGLTTGGVTTGIRFTG
jgi:hypothetical protein